MTIKEATEKWVDGFNAIPQAVIEKLIAYNGSDEVREITPPTIGDYVYVYTLPDDADTLEHRGEITNYDEESGLYTVELDTETIVEVEEDDFEVERDGGLPMWGTMWSFGESIDDWWVEHGGLKAMADCGFRVYEQEDFGYIFGIDGAGYDFYELHWIPLYKARGLRWHDEEE